MDYMCSPFLWMVPTYKLQKLSPMKLKPIICNIDIFVFHNTLALFPGCPAALTYAGQPGN